MARDSREAMAGLDQPRRGRKKAIKPAATG